eukprot:gene908-1762_t
MAFSNRMHFPGVHPPVFGHIPTHDRTGNPNASNNISLDDIFDEFLFANEQRDTLKNERSPVGAEKSAYNGGDNYDGKDDYGDDDSFDGDGDGDGDDGEDGQGKRKKRSRGQQRYMTEEQKVERRERNREHAKRSRVRKKFLLESLQQSVQALQDENEKLRIAIREHLPTEADGLLSTCSQSGGSIIADRPDEATKTLDDPDYSLVKALQTAQQNFVITDPSMPDNPIVYASQGFLNLTGYSLDQVLGRNCRFLQGPGTDPRTVARIRAGIEKGEDTTTVLLNYRADQTTFWNQFFVAALRDGDGNIVNYLGVQCKVSDDYAVAFIKHEQLEDTKR